MNLYKEHILELYKEPHNFGSLASETHTKHKNNPICGDEITVHIIVSKERISDIRFDGRGCAISIASASMVTDAVKGKTIEQVRAMNQQDILDLLNIPVGSARMKCALLCLEAIKDALGENHA